MAKMMVQHNNFSFSKGNPPFNKKARSNTLVIDDFGDYFDWVDRIQTTDLISYVGTFKFKVKIGLSVVNHEDGDQFVRKTGYKLATSNLVETELRLVSFAFNEKADLFLYVQDEVGSFFGIELGPRGRMMIVTPFNYPDKLYRALYPRAKVVDAK